MTDQPCDKNSGQFELPDLSGLPKGPWRHPHNNGSRVVLDNDGNVVAAGHTTEIARAIRDIPAMVEEIGRLQDLLNRQRARTDEEDELRGNALNDLDSLRALNAELQEMLTSITDQLERIGDTRMHKDGQFIADARALLAKSELADAQS